MPFWGVTHNHERTGSSTGKEIGNSECSGCMREGSNPDNRGRMEPRETLSLRHRNEGIEVIT